MPNFDELSQSTAEIKLLAVSENWWPSHFRFRFRPMYKSPACHFECHFS